MINNDDNITKALLFLMYPQNTGKKFLSKELAENANIPLSRINTIMYLMRQQGLLTMNSYGSKSEFGLSELGIARCNEMQDIYFQQNGRPLIHLNRTIMNIQDACESVFQLHKNEINYKHYWSRESFNGMPENTSAALDLLLHKNIIHGNSKVSSINPDLFDCNSYNEAVNKLDEINARNNPKHVISITDSNVGQIGDRTTHGTGSHISDAGINYTAIIKEKDEKINQLDDDLKKAQILLTKEQTKLTTLQSKELKYKIWYSIGGTIGGALLTNADRILVWLKHL